MKKRLLASALVLCLSASLLVGCGGKKEEGENAQPTQAPSSNNSTPAGDNNQEGSIKYDVPQNIIDGAFPVITPENVKVTETMCEKAILNMGNSQRVAEVMDRAAHGQDITIAYIGGSITAGSSAEPQEEKCYVGLMKNWWDNTFPDANITYINAGIGATDSYLGVHRAQQDVIYYKPDLVIVEFSVNDSGKSAAKESYESLLRMLLNSETEPAVVSLIITQQANYNQDHQLIAKNLDIPIISQALVVKDNLAQAVWKWSEIGAADGTHPINDGHAVIAEFLSYYFNKVLSTINTTSYSEYKVPDKKKTLSRYENADIVYANAIVVEESDGYELKDVTTNVSKNAYVTTSNGSIQMRVDKATSVGVVYWATTDGKSGSFDVEVNGEKVTTIKADASGEWGDYANAINLGNHSSADTWTIKITPAEDSEGTNLQILALTVSK